MAHDETPSPEQIDIIWFVADPGTPIVLAHEVGTLEFIMYNSGLDFNTDNTRTAVKRSLTFSVARMPITAVQEQVFQLRTNDETAVVKPQGNKFGHRCGNTKTKLVLEHYRSLGGPRP